LAAAVLAIAVGRAGSRTPEAPPASRLRYAALLLVAFSGPLAAWSAAGLETGLAAALAALAVALPELGHPRAGCAAAGLVAALRPEALPWALVVAASPPPLACASPARPGAARAARVALAFLPFLVVVAVRVAVFGHPIPLSVYAKPSTV